MTTWERKAHERIAKLSFAAWLAANTTKAGKPRRRHVPYVIPLEADALVRALAIHDDAERELAVKRIFLYGVDGYDH